jgi:hypothetical protein
MANEAMCKILAHNLVVLIHETSTRMRPDERSVTVAGFLRRALCGGLYGQSRLLKRLPPRAGSGL